MDLTSCNGIADTSLLSHFMNYQNVWKIGGYLVYEGNVRFVWFIGLDIVTAIIANMLYVTDTILSSNFMKYQNVRNINGCLVYEVTVPSNWLIALDVV